jgi:hypothetical protein
MYSSFNNLNIVSWVHIDMLNKQGQCILIYVIFTPFPSSHQGSVWVLPVISLLLTSPLSQVWACPITRWERFRGTQKEDDRRPLSIQSSLC